MQSKTKATQRKEKVQKKNNSKAKQQYILMSAEIARVYMCI